MIVPLDGSELAEPVLPTVTEISKKLRLEVFLIRAYRNPYSGFISGGGHYAVNVDELMESVRDQARNYLEAKMAELKKQRCRAGFLSTSGRDCGRRDCVHRSQDTRESDRHVLPRPVRRETLGLGQRGRNRGAALAQSGAGFAPDPTGRRMTVVPSAKSSFR